MSLKDNVLWFLSFGTRVPPVVKQEKIPNKQAEALALRLIKSREKYKNLQNMVDSTVKNAEEVIAQMSLYLISAIAKNNGSLVIQKDMLDSLKDKVQTLAIKMYKVEDSPGDVELKIVDLSKEIVEAAKAASEK